MFKMENYQNYLSILNEELIPAMGCTEPIAVAYICALAKAELGEYPSHLKLLSSGNIIKNAKSVVVPNTGGLKGMRASILAGLIGGDSTLGLEVLSKINKEEIAKINDNINTDDISIERLETPITLHLIAIATKGDHTVEIEIQHQHTNVVRITKDGVNQAINHCSNDANNVEITDRSILSIDQILDFVEIAKFEDYQEILNLQVEYNINIANEGLNNDYGANVGSTILKYGNDTVEAKVKAMTAAGSDARMNGSTMPVVTNSGSGNQGMTCSVPVITYAKEINASSEKMFKALLLSNLVTIHVKTGLTRLSCYCGAVVAASGASAGLMYLDNGDREQIKMAITNTLGNVSGIICDGAKESCASKIATSIDAAFQSKYLASDHHVFSHGCGIVEDDIEATIKNVGIVGRVGMKSTDDTILEIMTNIKN